MKGSFFEISILGINFVPALSSSADSFFLDFVILLTETINKIISKIDMNRTINILFTFRIL